MKRQEASEMTDLPNQASQYLANYETAMERWISNLSTAQRDFVASAPVVQFSALEIAPSEESKQIID